MKQQQADHIDLFLISFDFTPLDSSAVYVLSSMARRRQASRSSGEAVSPDRDASQGCCFCFVFVCFFFNYYDIKYHNENENHKPVAFFENPQKLRVVATPALLIRGQTESRTAAQRKAITRPPSASDQWTPSCCLPRSSGWSTHRCTLGKTTGGCQSAVLTGVGRQTKADRIE